jgi:hypothetical protein
VRGIALTVPANRQLVKGRCGADARTCAPTSFLQLPGGAVHVQFIIGFKIRIRAVVSSISVYSAVRDLGLHHGLDGLFVLACDANGELIERGHHGVMATEQTCQ